VIRLWGSAVAIAAIVRGRLRSLPRAISTNQRLAMLADSAPAAAPVLQSSAY